MIDFLQFLFVFRWSWLMFCGFLMFFPHWSLESMILLWFSLIIVVWGLCFICDAYFCFFKCSLTFANFENVPGWARGLGVYIIGPRKKDVPLDIFNMCRCYFGLPGIDCTTDEKSSRRSRPPSAADFLCWFGVLNTDNSWKSKNKIYTYWVYLMEHLLFEVQICIKISICCYDFCEFSNFLPDCH